MILGLFSVSQKDFLRLSKCLPSQYQESYSRFTRLKPSYLLSVEYLTFFWDVENPRKVGKAAEWQQRVPAFTRRLWGVLALFAVKMLLLSGLQGMEGG